MAKLEPSDRKALEARPRVLGLKVILLAMTTALILGATVQAAERTGPGGFGMKVGHIGQGNVVYQRTEAGSVSDTAETDGNLSGGVFFEKSIVGGLRAVVTIDIHKIKLYGPSALALDGGVGLRYSWINPTGLIGLRPGVTVGYAVLPEVWQFRSSKYVTIKPQFEVVFYSEHGTGMLVEVGALYLISGGNNQYDISAGPMIMFRMGMLM
jgi:hypothetical protein